MRIHIKDQVSDDELEELSMLDVHSLADTTIYKRLVYYLSHYAKNNFSPPPVVTVRYYILYKTSDPGLLITYLHKPDNAKTSILVLCLGRGKMIFGDNEIEMRKGDIVFTDNICQLHTVMDDDVFLMIELFYFEVDGTLIDIESEGIIS